MATAVRGQQIQPHRRIGVGSNLVRSITKPVYPPGVTPYSPSSPGGTAAPPFDPSLEARRASGEARRSQLLSDANVDLQSTSQRYGFSYNPDTGAFGGFDPTNPFSQAALLAKTRDQHVSATNNSAAIRGLYNSGSRERGQKNVQSEYDRGYDTLRRGYEDYVTRYLRRKRDIQQVAPEEVANL